MRIRIGSATVDYDRCKPADLDLAIPETPVPLPLIMAGYREQWRRAFNGPYFYPGLVPQPEGILWREGKMYSWFDLQRPCLLVYYDGTARIIEKPSRAEVESSRIAFSAGPELFVASFEQEMEKGRYSGFPIYADFEYPQAAIGLTTEGDIVHAATMVSSLPELADIMRELGCVSAMRLDGGSSMGVLERTGRIFGSVHKSLTAAVVMKGFAGPPIWLFLCVVGLVGGSVLIMRRTRE